MMREYISNDARKTQVTYYLCQGKCGLFFESFLYIYTFVNVHLFILELWFLFGGNNNFPAFNLSLSVPLDIEKLRVYIHLE